jgi:oxepin-CoA hydrolase / 3-oxo-5,6-dehydrosuberyl-CoA semialdehyde dehydrogenase
MQELTLAHANDFFENELDGLLKNLTPSHQALWGQMTPQHMVEHLTWAMDGAMERWEATVITPEEKLPKLRAFLRSNLAMRHHFQHPQMPPQGELPALRLSNLEAAREEFWQRWAEYEQFALNNPDKLVDHVVFGPLNPDEWRLMHFKHVVHHFSQFGLTTVEAHGLVMPEAR